MASDATASACARAHALRRARGGLGGAADGGDEARARGQRRRQHAREAVARARRVDDRAGRGTATCSPASVVTSAPSAPSVTTTAAAPAARSAAPGADVLLTGEGAPRLPLATTVGRALRTSGGGSRTGEGVDQQRAAARRPRPRAVAATVPGGISKLTTQTSPGSTSSSPASTCSGASAMFAPDATTMWFSPARSTQMTAMPVARPGSLWTAPVSTPSPRQLADARAPSSSSPTAATSRTRAPSRAAATATLAPLPPPARTGSPASTVAPGAGAGRRAA